MSWTKKKTECKRLHLIEQEQRQDVVDKRIVKFLFYVLTLYYNRVIIRYRKKEEEKMRKLEQNQKDMIMNRFVYAYMGVKTTAVARIIIMNIEKYGKQENDLEEDIHYAIEIATEQAQ
jgi:hypothetical protein